jgi:hypothetical protein
MNNQEILELFNKTNKWIEILDSNHFQNYPDNWAGLKEVQLAHIQLMNQIVKKTYDLPKYKYEKGIVIGAGGAKYFGCAFACFYILKKLGCNLPVEFWYLDEYEMDNHMKHLCDIFYIKYINATKYCKENNINPRILNGWELKPFATLHSDFQEVLYLDADNIPAKNPMYLFDNNEYKDLGSIFWPDLPPHKRKDWLPAICWENVGLEYIDEVDFETGQYLINKTKCFKELNLTMWMNEHSDWFYKFVYGDKSTFHLAWRKCGSNYVIPKRAAGWKHPCILQYDTDGQLVFQHACQGKEIMFSGSGPTNHLNHHLITEAKTIRDKYWSGIIYSWNEMNESEKQYADQYIGKYKYSRINLDSRVLELKDGGLIGEGWAKCERRWSVRIIDDIPTIIVIGAAHKDSEIAMFFAKDGGDGKLFNGQWTAFEKCPIVLERL